VFLIISYVFSSINQRRVQNRFCPKGRGGRGEVARTMCTHVSKYKNNKRRKGKQCKKYQPPKND
jgi:hypothetical protein